LGAVLQSSSITTLIDQAWLYHDSASLKNTLGIFDWIAVSPQFLARRFESFKRREKLPQVMALHTVGCDHDRVVQTLDRDRLILVGAQFFLRRNLISYWHCLSHTKGFPRAKSARRLVSRSERYLPLSIRRSTIVLEAVALISGATRISKGPAIGLFSHLRFNVVVCGFGWRWGLGSGAASSSAWVVANLKAANGVY
jgi:hypothetical protein